MIGNDEWTEKIAEITIEDLMVCDYIGSDGKFLKNPYLDSLSVEKRESILREIKIPEYVPSKPDIPDVISRTCNKCGGNFIYDKDSLVGRFKYSRNGLYDLGGRNIDGKFIFKITGKCEQCGWIKEETFALKAYKLESRERYDDEMKDLICSGRKNERGTNGRMIHPKICKTHYDNSYNISIDSIERIEETQLKELDKNCSYSRYDHAKRFIEFEDAKYIIHVRCNDCDRTEVFAVSFDKVKLKKKKLAENKR